MIHPSVIIGNNVEVGNNVTIGPYSVIGPDVSISDNCQIGSHVVIKGPTRIGQDNRIYHFCSIGEDPQDKKYRPGDDSRLEIGERNLIREYCTINRGTANGGGKTVIGNDNWIMAYVHIAHDCHIGDHTIFANNTTLAGHVTIDHHVILGGFTGVHQFCKIGCHAFTAISTVITKDIPPFLMVSGNTAIPGGLNREGMKRHGYTHEQIDDMKKAYKIVYRQGLTVQQALKELEAMSSNNEDIRYFAEFIAASNRGIVR